MIGHRKPMPPGGYRRYGPLAVLLAAMALVAGPGAGCGDNDITTTTPTSVTGPTGPTGEQGEQ
jgi:hypothetical protein